MEARRSPAIAFEGAALAKGAKPMFGHNVPKLERRGDVHGLIRAAVFNSHEQARQDAMAALARLRDPAVEALVSQICELARQYAQLRLGPAAWEPLKARGSYMLTRLAYCLGTIGEPAVDPLAEVLLDGRRDPEERFWCASALGMTRSPRAVDALLEALNDGDDSLVAGLVATLGETGDRRALEAVRSVVEQGRGGSRGQEAVARLGSSVPDDESRHEADSQPTK